MAANRLGSGYFHRTDRCIVLVRTTSTGLNNTGRWKTSRNRTWQKEVPITPRNCGSDIQGMDFAEILNNSDTRKRRVIGGRALDVSAGKAVKLGANE